MLDIADCHSRASAGKGISPRPLFLVDPMTVPAAREEAASLGRWWFEPQSAQMILFVAAVRYLHVEAPPQHSLDSCFVHAVAEGLAQLSSGLPFSGSKEFRVISPRCGLRWLST